MDNINKFFDFVFRHEGYKSDNANDRGRLTIWGIASRWWPKEVAEMQNMTPEAAKEYAKGFYYRNFWAPLNCDKYPPRVQLALFDSAVNCGVPVVQTWVKELTTPKGNIEMILTAHGIIFKRQQYYQNICDKDASQRANLADPGGWLQRTLDLWAFEIN